MFDIAWSKQDFANIRVSLKWNSGKTDVLCSLGILKLNSKINDKIMYYNLTEQGP